MSKSSKAAPQDISVLLSALIIAIVLAWGSVVYGQSKVSLAATSKTNTFSNAYITLKYPNWKAVDTSQSPYKDNLLVAVKNGDCLFMLITAAMPPGSTLKDFMTTTVDQQSQDANVKFLTKTMTDDHFIVDVTMPSDDISIRQYAYGVLGSDHAIYQITFLGPAKTFVKACSPNISTTIKSIKLLNPPSEKADAKKLSEYFKSLNLGKLAIGKKVAPPKSVPVKTNVFTASKDQFCIIGLTKKDIPAGAIASAMYSVETQLDVKEKSASTELMKAGSGINCGSLTGLPPGRYEFKVYLDDVLAAVLPFTVKK
jgi:hypothetical protein